MEVAVLMAILVLEFEGSVFEVTRLSDFQMKSKYQKSFYVLWVLAETVNLIPTPVPYSLVVFL